MLRDRLVVPCLVVAGLSLASVTRADQMLYVANAYDLNPSIQTFDSAGNGSTFADSTTNPDLAVPYAMVFDSAGNLLVANNNGGNILLFDPAGNSSAFATLPGFSAIVTGVAFDGAGNLYASDEGDDLLYKIDSSGNPTVFSNSSSFSAVDQIAWHDNNLYVANYGASQVLMFDSDGIETLFADSSSGLAEPDGFAFDAAGNVYVASYDNDTIFKFDPAGSTVTTFADASDGLSGPAGMAFDASGNLFVANYDSNEILKFDPTGATVTVFAPDAKLDHPNSVVFAPVPEPTGLSLLAIAGIGILRRRRRA